MRPAFSPSRWLIVPLVIAIGGCEVSSEGPRDREPEGTTAMMPASEVDSIARRMRTEFADWFASGGDASTMVPQMYAPDAIFSDELGTTHSGRAALQRAFSQMAPGSSIEIRSFGAVGSGDLLVDLGAYEVSYPMPDGQRMNAMGRYMIAYQRMDDGSWKVVRQLTTSGAPPAAGGGAAADSAAARPSAAPADSARPARGPAVRPDTATP